MFLVTVDQEATGSEIVIVNVGDRADDQVAEAAGMTTGAPDEAVAVAADDVIEKSSRLGCIGFSRPTCLLLYNHFHMLANISLKSFITSIYNIVFV